MKIKINDYEVNISAKDTICSKQANKKDTLSLLNWLSIALKAGANYEESITCYAIADEMQKAADNIYKICYENGLYQQPIKKEQ